MRGRFLEGSREWDGLSVCGRGGGSVINRHLKSLMRLQFLGSFVLFWLLSLSAMAPRAQAQIWGSRALNAVMRPSGELLNRQDPPRVNQGMEGQITSANSSVVISLGRQRLYVMMGEEVYLDSPISSGKAGHATPKGRFVVTEKDLNHRSSIYGNFVDGSGRVVRAGVSTRSDVAPSGTRYQGAPMKYFCRLTSSGVGFHVGILPGYPASHGCIRLPESAAALIYAKVAVGTKVVVTD